MLNRRTMRLLLTILLLIGGWSTTQASSRFHEPRTDDNWQVFYGESIVAEGNAMGTGQYLADTIVYQSTRSRLTVYYNSDAVYQRERTIQIWEGESLLSTQTFKESDMSVDLQEVLMVKTKSKVVTLRLQYIDKATGADYQIAALSFSVERK